MKNKKILVICGPTATGKTSLGISLAQKLKGEIVSADSRQVYQGMNIATGKDLPEGSAFNLKFSTEDKKVGYYLFENIPVWLLDIIRPDVKFSVADYYELAWRVIDDIWKQGNLPIIVGGTGFYIKALLGGLDTMGIAPDWILREELKDSGAPQLRGLLLKISPERIKKMNDSDQQNPRRLMRAIEVELNQKRNGKIHTGLRKEFEVLSLGLTDRLLNLYGKIDRRIEKQIKDGAEEEVKDLIKDEYSWDLPSMTAMGYREWREYFSGKKSRPETIKVWKYNEHGYARKQMTWFRKIRNVNWFDIGDPGWQERVEKLVQDWYS